MMNESLREIEDSIKPAQHSQWLFKAFINVAREQ